MMLSQVMLRCALPAQRRWCNIASEQDLCCAGASHCTSLVALRSLRHVKHQPGHRYASRFGTQQPRCWRVQEPTSLALRPCAQVARASDAASFDAIDIDNSRLVWDSDRDTFFGNYEASNLNTLPEFRGGAALRQNVSQSESFMEWERPAAHPSARPSCLHCVYGWLQTFACL